MVEQGLAPKHIAISSRHDRRTTEYYRHITACAILPNITATLPNTTVTLPKTTVNQPNTTAIRPPYRRIHAVPYDRHTTAILPPYYRHATTILVTYHRHTAAVLLPYYRRATAHHTDTILPPYYHLLLSLCNSTEANPCTSLSVSERVNTGKS